MQRAKDFGQYYLKKNNEEEYYDPFIYTTKQVQQEIINMQQEGILSVSVAHFAATLVIAPLQTIVTSLQLSVKPHKNIFQPPAAKTKQVAKLTTSLTLQEKRKLQLMIRTGSNQKPYTAPVYDGYIGTIKGLMSQGGRAFFKGLLFRSIHQLSPIFCFTQVGLARNNAKDELQRSMGDLTNIVKLYFLKTICDLSFNILHIAENRYILQNNIAEFRVFRNINKVFSKMLIRKQVFKGFSYHFYNNFGEILIKVPFLFGIANNNFHEGLCLAYYLSELLMYPVNTAFKRVICQHKDIPGMIPIRYTSIGHALRLILSEQGIIGLYRGFGLHQINSIIKIGILASLMPIINTVNTAAAIN